MLISELTVVASLLVAAARAGCEDNTNCGACLRQSPDNLLEGVYCLFCQNNNGATLCAGSVEKNILDCGNTAKSHDDCAAKYPTTTTQATVVATSFDISTTQLSTPPLTPMPTVTMATEPFFNNTSAPEVDNNGVAIAIGVIVALILLAAFVLAAVWVVLKYRKQAMVGGNNGYGQPYETGNLNQHAVTPSFSVGSGRVLDGPQGYSGRDTYTSPSDAERKYSAMPYVATQSNDGSFSQDPMRRSGPSMQQATPTDQYFNLSVVKPPPKTIDINGNATMALDGRSGTIADELPDIPGGYSSQAQKQSFSRAVDDDNGPAGYSGAKQQPQSMRALDKDPSAISNRDPTAVDVNNMDSNRINAAFDEMAAALDEI